MDALPDRSLSATDPVSRNCCTESVSIDAFDVVHLDISAEMHLSHGKEILLRNKIPRWLFLAFGKISCISRCAQLTTTDKSILPGKCRIDIKFREKFKKSAVKTFQILTEAYGDETLSRAQVFEWYKQFSEGRVSVEEDESAGNQRGKRPELGSDEWLLHQDNAPAHTARSVKQFLISKNIPMMGYPPYSPDLAPCDFLIFPTVKSC
ncbi:uncharacterized protein TNCV_5010261 [Trichonephila clavipes]|nr:uncharacterized protein TNCV_5010261 [Trichonephila clavipes]